MKTLSVELLTSSVERFTGMRLRDNENPSELHLFKSGAKLKMFKYDKTASAFFIVGYAWDGRDIVRAVEELLTEGVI